MDDVISAVQVGQSDNTESLTAQSMLSNGPPPLLPREAKDLVSVKRILAGEVNWECVKEVFGWIIDTKSGTFALPECKLQELWDLLGIPISQQHIGRKDLKRLVGKLRSIHLAVPGRCKIFTISNVRWPRQGQIGPGCLQPSTARLQNGKYWRNRQLTDPLTSPISSVANPPIWGSSTPQDLGPGECG